MKHQQAPRGAWVGAGPEGAWGSGLGQARCQAAGEGPPDAGSRRSGAVGRRPRGAGASPSFLPPNPSLALRFSGDPPHSPATSGRPLPSSSPPARPCLCSPPSPAPASAPSSPSSPRGPPRPGPLPLVAAAPFTIALPASLHSAPGSLPPAALSAHARSGRRRLRRLRFF